MWPSLDVTYGELSGRLPGPRRALAAGLLERLRVVTCPGAGWEDFVRLEPDRELPLFAAEGLSRRGRAALTPHVLARFLAAHHCAVFHGLLADRLADGQVVATRELRVLSRHFLDEWRRRLALAVGDAEQSRCAIAHVQRVFQRGVRRERVALQERSLSIALYTRLLLARLGWSGLAADGLLRFAGEDSRRRGFLAAFHFLLMSLQCLDDAVDCVEDEHLRGVSIPAALGFPPAGLARAAAHLARRGAEIAREERFHRFGQWLEEHAARIDTVRFEGDTFQGGFAGFVIASGMEETWQRRMRAIHPTSVMGWRDERSPLARRKTRSATRHTR